MVSWDRWTYSTFPFRAPDFEVDHEGMPFWTTNLLELDAVDFCVKGIGRFFEFGKLGTGGAMTQSLSTMSDLSVLNDTDSEHADD